MGKFTTAGNPVERMRWEFAIYRRESHEDERGRKMNQTKWQKSFKCTMPLLAGALLMCLAAAPVRAQDVVLFFPAADLEETSDEFGNIYSTSPASAVIPLPESFGGDPEVTGLLVDPAYLYETFTDDEGNSYTTAAADASLGAAEAYTDTDNRHDNLWRLRGSAWPDWGVLEAWTTEDDGNPPEDCPALKTTVTMARGGTYNVFLLYGDVGAANEEDDATNPTPIQAALQGNELKTYFQADGNLITGAYGWNILEVKLGSVSVGDNGTIEAIIDDVVEGGQRCAYIGLRITTGGPVAQSSYDFNQDNLWLMYEIYGTGRKLLLSNAPPDGGEDSPELTTSITVAHAGTYEVIFHFNDSDALAEEGIIMVALNDDELMEMTGVREGAIRATGGTSPPYPWIDNTTQGAMFWYTYPLAEALELQAGDTIRVRVDDMQDWTNIEYMACSYEGRLRCE